MAEFNFIPEARKYLSTYIEAKIESVFEMSIDCRKNENSDYNLRDKIVDCVDWITQNFSDNFSEPNIPEKYATVTEMINAAENFHDELKTKRTLFEKTENLNSELPSIVMQWSIFRLEIEKRFAEFIRLSKEEIRKHEEEKELLDLEGKDARKYKPKAIIYFLKKCSLYSHWWIWGSLSSYTLLVLWFSTFFKPSNQNKNDELSNFYSILEKKNNQTNMEVETKNKIIDSLINLSEKRIHDTIYKEITERKDIESETKKSNLYFVSNQNIKEGISFSDKEIGVSITLSNISIDFTATAVHDIPDMFGAISAKNVKVTAGKFWKFKSKEKNYKLVISKIDYLSSTYGIELFELRN